jgi:hypothetical protein
MRPVRREPRSPSLAWLHSPDMAGPFFDAVERAQLSDLFDELGPQAPTLLTPWTTRDLAAHLVLRERDYLAGGRRGAYCPVGHPHVDKLIVLPHGEGADPAIGYRRVGPVGKAIQPPIAQIRQRGVQVVSHHAALAAIRNPAALVHWMDESIKRRHRVAGQFHSLAGQRFECLDDRVHGPPPATVPPIPATMERATHDHASHQPRGRP